MLLTGSIRRKMMLGLALVAAMVALLLVTTVSGLVSYGKAVDDLDFSINRAPRSADLSAAVGGLFEPLLLETDGSAEAVRLQHDEIQSRLNVAWEALQEFRRRRERLPQSPQLKAQRPVTDALLGDVERRLYRVAKLNESLLERRDVRQMALERMLREVAHVESQVGRVPDVSSGLAQTMEQTLAGYRSRLWVACVAGGLVVVLFLGLVWCGYRWIFAPLRVLCQGASRVAQGDFEYRVELKTNDEVAELAESFNAMTARFREIRDELDEQVRERSRQLVRSERLAGIGFLAAGVAHEINNPLSSISMAAESIGTRIPRMTTDPDSPDAKVVGDYVAMMQRESARCRDITTRLLEFARGQEQQRGRTDLVALVEEVLAMVRPMSKYRDRTIEFTPEGPCYVEVNGPEVKQVVLNLVANALEATEAGGRLTITLDERPDQVLLAFRDDGCGMTEEVRDHLFEPFFTRRKGGKGTGLGLSISHRIVNDHGGTLEATSDGPGTGSTFRLLLPKRAAGTEAAAA